MLQRHEKMTTLLQTNLEEIKNNLEMSNSSLRIKLENEVESLKNENQILKRRIESETERSRDFLKNVEVKLEQAKEKIKLEEDKCTSFAEENADFKSKIDILNKEITVLKTTLENQNQSSEEPVVQIMDNSKMEMITLKSELESLRNQFELQKSNTEEYKNLSNVLESQLALATETNTTINSEFDSKLSEKDGRISTLQLELENLTKQFNNHKSEAVAQIHSISAKSNEVEIALQKTIADYENARSNLLKLEQELEHVKVDLDKETKIKEELREQLDREVVLRGEETLELGKLKTLQSELRCEIDKQTKLAEKSEETLSFKIEEFKSKESDYQKELKDLATQVKEYSDACERLEGQLTSVLTTKTAEQVDFTTGDKSSEQWLQLIRFLRREKEIAVSKMESALAQSERLESQFAALKEQYEEVKLELGRVSGGEGTVGLLTSVKQAELLRKVETLSALSDSNR